MTREQKYAEQLKALGVYREAFDPEIHTLAIMERDLQRMLKAWKADGSPITDVTAQGTTTSNKTLDAIGALRRDILAHRDALGLTPKGLARLTGKKPGRTAEAEDQASRTVLELVRSKRKSG